MEVTQEQLQKVFKERQDFARATVQRMLKLIDECNPEVVTWDHILYMGIITEAASSLLLHIPLAGE